MKRKTKKRLTQWLAVVLCILIFLPILTYFIPSNQAANSSIQVLDADEIDLLEEKQPENKPDIPENCSGPYEVVGVKNGDRIHIAVQNDTFLYVDLLGIETEDAPDSAAEEGQSAGLQSYAHARELVQGKQIYLDYDGEITDDEPIEALVYLNDGTLLNEKMLEDGFAKTSTSLPSEVEDRFSAAMQNAKENQNGLWKDLWNETK